MIGRMKSAERNKNRGKEDDMRVAMNDGPVSGGRRRRPTVISRTTEIRILGSCGNHTNCRLLPGEVSKFQDPIER